MLNPNNKDEDNSPKNLNDKNQQASSQKFRQLEKIIQTSILISLLVKLVERWGVCDKSKNEQNINLIIHEIFAKESYDTQENPEGHCIGTCWALPLLCNS